MCRRTLGGTALAVCGRCGFCPTPPCCGCSPPCCDAAHPRHPVRDCLAEEQPMSTRDPRDDLPDVGDGLTHRERVILWCLKELQEERGGGHLCQQGWSIAVWSSMLICVARKCSVSWCGSAHIHSAFRNG